MGTDGALKGRVACKYVDDCIWFLRDLARQRPKHAFDHPFLAGFKKVHEATGLKVQFNLFYRTDFFYGMDEFTLAGMPDTYKAEFQTNADWIKFGFHSLDQLKADLDAVKDANFVGYGNHEQYFFKDYLAYQPEYMEKEMLCARTLRERGHRFVFMEDQV